MKRILLLLAILTLSLPTFAQVVDCNIVQIDGQATNGNNATLFLKRLDIQNSDANKAALYLSGGGAGTPFDGGYGLFATSKAPVPAGLFYGGDNLAGNSGGGLEIDAGTPSDGNNANPALWINGGAPSGAGNPGPGVKIIGGGSALASAQGVVITAGNAAYSGVFGRALDLVGNTGSDQRDAGIFGDGIAIRAGKSGAGIRILGGNEYPGGGGIDRAAGSGVVIDGGETSSDGLAAGIGVDIHGGDSSSDQRGATAFNIWGGDGGASGSGIGLSISNETGGATHPAVLIAPNSGNTDAIQITAAGTGRGLNVTGATGIVASDTGATPTALGSNLVQVNGGSTGSTAGKLDLKQMTFTPTTGQNAIDILVDQGRGINIHDGGNFGSGIWIQTKFVPFTAISSDNEAAHFRVTGSGAGEPAILIEGAPAGAGTPGAPGILTHGGDAGTGVGEEAGTGILAIGGVSSGAGAKAAGTGITIQAGPNDSGNPVAPGYLAVGTDTAFANYWNGALPTGNVNGISISGLGSGKAIDVTGTTTLGLTLQKNKEHLFAFVMYATNGNPAAGLSVTCTRKLDTGSFAACTNAPTGGTGGAYTVLLSAADMNGEVAVLKLEATGARTLMIPIVTQN